MGIPQNSQQKFWPIAATIPGDCGKLFLMPLDDELRTHADGLLHPQAGARGRRVLNGCRSNIRSSALVFPGNLRQRPNGSPGLSASCSHAICIGRSSREFNRDLITLGSFPGRLPATAARPFLQRNTTQRGREGSTGGALWDTIPCGGIVGLPQPVERTVQVRIRRDLEGKPPGFLPLHRAYLRIFFQPRT